MTIVLAPYLTWDDVEQGRVPAIARLADKGAIANVNVHGPDDSDAGRSLARGALSLSSGAFASIPSGAPAAFTVGERVGGEDAATYYTRTTGFDVADNKVLFLGIPAALRGQNAANGVVPGSLGQAVTSAGGVTIALGNSDTGVGTDDVGHFRPAGIAAMDADGRVRLGDVSPTMLAAAADAPFGVRTDLSALETAYSRALDEAGDRKTLVVLDPGDTVRATSFAPLAAENVAETQRERALKTVDAVVAMAAKDLPADGVLMVVSPVMSPASGGLGFAPLVVYGRGFAGSLRSSSTHRSGLVTLLDLNATALAQLGLDRPSAVAGNEMTSEGSDVPFARRLAALRAMESETVAVDAAKPLVLNGFIISTVVLVVLCTLLLLRLPRFDPRRGTQLVHLALLLMLFDLSVPVAGTLMFVFGLRPRGAGDATLLLLVVAAAVWLVWFALRRTRRPRIPLACACLAMTALVLVDQWLGAPFSLAGFFSYSTLIGARYYGLGNEGASLLVASGLVGLALLFDEFAEERWVAPVRTWGLPVFGLVVVATAAAPALGANIGVVAWGTAAFVVAWALMNGHRLTWKTFALFGVVVVALVALFSALDLGAGAANQTHLARAISGTDTGGLAALWAIVARKAAMSAAIFTGTSWSYLLIAVLAFLAYVRWRPQGGFKKLFATNPYFSAALAACLFGSAASLLSEDSGIVMPALMMLYVGVGVLYLMLAEAMAER